MEPFFQTIVLSPIFLQSRVILFLSEAGGPEGLDFCFCVPACMQMKRSGMLSRSWDINNYKP